MHMQAKLQQREFFVGSRKSSVSRTSQPCTPNILRFLLKLQYFVYSLEVIYREWEARFEGVEVEEVVTHRTKEQGVYKLGGGRLQRMRSFNAWGSWCAADLDTMLDHVRPADGAEPRCPDSVLTRRHVARGEGRASWRCWTCLSNPEYVELTLKSGDLNQADLLGPRSSRPESATTSEPEPEPGPEYACRIISKCVRCMNRPAASRSDQPLPTDLGGLAEHAGCIEFYIVSLGISSPARHFQRKISLGLREYGLIGLLAVSGIRGSALHQQLGPARGGGWVLVYFASTSKALSSALAKSPGSPIAPTCAVTPTVKTQANAGPKILLTWLDLVIMDDGKSRTRIGSIEARGNMFNRLTTWIIFGAYQDSRTTAFGDQGQCNASQ
ncbi:uncharacterized protein EI90DRAFT_3012840 [Cantharellus anzutake]|uniref:uncharacterized protein n=1 Tax=Cantharellus anzutake TaxID=1750568 RepID=UPI001903FB69|nr:uncharacterized protein EI90DRAFT_3012840 [Cantharellus anzutake]KAF8339937.1 hypothetical protein EI90DRAFT_3012840 [Cantharellus anzutake]